MAGRRKWSELRAKVAPEVLAEAAVKTEQMVASYRLRDLREARGLTQNQLAERLDIRQVSVSRLEAREDVRVSTLRSVFEALGAKMEIRAVFPDAEYRVDFGDEARSERIESIRQPPVASPEASGPPVE